MPAKPRTRRKRQSINFNPKANKKRTATSSKKNKEQSDKTDNDIQGKAPPKEHNESEGESRAQSGEGSSTTGQMQDTPKKLHERKQSIINFNPNSSKKRSVAPRKHADTDLNNDEAKDKTPQEQNESERESSRQSGEERSKMGKKRGIPKESRKRKQSVNVNSKPNKKRAVVASKYKNNRDEGDHGVAEKIAKHGQNEDQKSSESDAEENSSSANKTSPDTRASTSGDKVSKALVRRKTPGTSRTLSKRSSTSSAFTSVRTPELPINDEKSLENEEDGQLHTDKTFLQQQIQLLSTAFTLQDCPGLTDKRKRKGCVPHEVIKDALRKLNHKMDDEIQKHLNRQCQRKVLADILEVEKDTTGDANQQERKEKHLTETMSVSEILEKCSGELDRSGEKDRELVRRFSNSVAKLQRLHDEMRNIKQKIAAYESNNLMVLEVECLAKESTQRSLHKEVERTNELVDKVTRVLRHKANSS